MQETKKREPRRIVLFNDLPGYGKVALAAMVPLLSRMGHYIWQVPTAVVSNTLDMGACRIEDMTSFMRDTLAVWNGFGLEPDCICTGFILSAEQAGIILDYIRSRKPDGRRLVMVDPIMADGGHLYRGIGEDRIGAMRSLVRAADVCVPNMTEAGFLTGIRPGAESASPAQLMELLDGLRALSGRSAVITSAVEEEGGRRRHLVCGYDHLRGAYFKVPYTYLPVRVAGSGDIFSAVMTGALLDGEPLEKAAGKAAAVLSRLISENESHLDGYKGILVEKYWEVFADG